MITKLKCAVLEHLPFLTLCIVWAPLNIGTAFFYTLQYYHTINIIVDIVGVLSFWISIKYHNKYLNDKTRKQNETTN